MFIKKNKKICVKKKSQKIKKVEDLEVKVERYFR